MKIIDEFKKMLKGKPEYTDIYKLSESENLYSEDIVNQIKKDLSSRKLARMPIERQWMLNANYLMGNQYCDISEANIGDVDNDIYSDSSIERDTFNRISPLIEARISNLKKLKFYMSVIPSSDETEDCTKADVSTEIIRDKQKKSNFDNKIASALVWNEICGNAFILSWWNPVSGEIVYRDDKEVIREGDVDYSVISPYDVYPEDLYQSDIASQRSIIIEQVKPVEEVFDLYGIRVKGEKVDVMCPTLYKSSSTPSFQPCISHCTKENAARIITYFERSSRRYPKGRMIVICADKIIHYGDLPYVDVPIVQLKCKESAGQFFAKSTIEELIPLQKAYNSCVNRIHEYIRRIAIGEYFVEEGSIDIDEYEENGLKAGALLVYRQGYQPPQRVNSPTLPNEVLSERIQLQKDMEYTAGVSQLMVVGAAPTGVVSGTAMETLRDIDNTRLSVTGDYIRLAVKQMAKIWLGMYKLYANVPRVLKNTGKNMLSGALVWSREDITDYDIEYEISNELSSSYDNQRQKFLQGYSMGLFNDENGKIPLRIKRRAQKFLNLEYPIDITDTDSLHEEKAKRENVLLNNFIIPQIEEYDDDKIHYEEHLRYALQTKFYMFEKTYPNLARSFKEHIKNHKKRIEEKKNI